jgi:hypothetical protein
MALALNFANILGGLVLAGLLLARLPRVGDTMGRIAARLTPAGWVIGIVALVAGGYFLIVHLFEGYILHFEVVGIAVGVLLAWERLTGRRPLITATADPTTGAGLVLGIIGVIAIVVGLEGMIQLL